MRTGDGAQVLVDPHLQSPAVLGDHDQRGAVRGNSKLVPGRLELDDEQIPLASARSARRSPERCEGLLEGPLEIGAGLGGEYCAVVR